MRTLAWIVVVVALALGAWFWQSRGGSPAPVSIPETAAESGATDQDVATGPRAGAATEHRPDAERQRVEPGFDGASVELQVVRFGTREPVSGALVRYQPPGFDWDALPAGEREGLVELFVHDRERWLERFGTAVVADAEGRCHVPTGDSAIEVTARHGALFGARSVRPGAGGSQTIIVREDHSLDVRVVDHSGQSVSDAAIESRHPGAEPPRTELLGRTDREGRFELPHVQLRVRADEPCRVALCASVPGAASRPVDVDLTAPPPEVVLTLPACGSVAVRFLEPDGRPVDVRYLEERTIRIAAFERPPDGGIEKVDAVEFEVPLDDASVARCERVGLGRQFVASYFPSLDIVRFAGPTRAGEKVEAVMQREAGSAVFVGRAVDAEDRPLADARIRLECRARYGTHGRAGTTDAEGRFRCAFGADLVGERVWVKVHTSILPSEGRSAELPRRTVTAGENDLGTVILMPPEVMLGGQLIADDGLDPRRVSMTVFDRRSLHSVDNLRPEIAADGTFVVRGSLSAGEPLRLTVQGSAFLPVEPIDCEAGTTDLRIRLSAGGQVTAVFLLDDPRSTGGLAIELRDADTGRPEHGARDRVQPDGRAVRTWGNLTPSTYELSVRCPGVESPVVELDGLVVGTGACDDPRLASIDLRGIVRTVTVRVTDAAGAAVSDRDAYVLVDTDGATAHAYRLERGRATIALDRPTDVLVLAPGYGVAEVRDLSDDTVVVLESAPELPVRVDSGANPAKGVDLFLVLKPDVGTANSDVGVRYGVPAPLEEYLTERALVGNDGIAHVAVRRAGTYRVAAEVRHDRSRRQVDEVLPSELYLDPTDVAGAVTVRVAPDALRIAIERLR